MAESRLKFCTNIYASPNSTFKFLNDYIVVIDDIDNIEKSGVSQKKMRLNSNKKVSIKILMFAFI